MEADEEIADHEAAGDAPKDEPKRADSQRGGITHEELNRLQRTVARRMAESKAPRRTS